MSQIVEQSRALARAGQWLELRGMEPALLTLTGEDLVQAHGQLYMAYFHSAGSPDDWRAALGHAQKILEMAPPESAMYPWALHGVAAVYANLRHPRETAVFARTLLKAAGDRPDLQYLVPHAWQHLGISAHLQGHHLRAVHCYRIAAAGFKAPEDRDELQRVQLYIVWNLLKLGRVEESINLLPMQTSLPLQSLWHASRALVAKALRDWSTARAEALLALNSPWASMDYVEAAEMCLLLAQVTLRHGARAEAVSWTKKATEFSARLGRATVTRLVLATAAEGGDFLAAVASRGSGGYHPDACFSTGVGG